MVEGASTTEKKMNQASKLETKRQCSALSTIMRTLQRLFVGEMTMREDLDDVAVFSGKILYNRCVGITNTPTKSFVSLMSHSAREYVNKMG